MSAKTEQQSFLSALVSKIDPEPKLSWQWTGKVLSWIVVCCLFVGPAAGQDWLQFRGPGARGVAEGPVTPPSQWSETENVLWKTGVPGRGWSSPIVVGQRVFVTTVEQKEGQPEEALPGIYAGGERDRPVEEWMEWKVLCLDLATGNVEWEKTLKEGVPQSSRHLKNSYASETPVSDGQRLYVLLGNVGCYCLDLKGNLIWEHPVAPRKTRNQWGTGASPVLHQDFLYLVNDNDEESYLVCLEKTTGEEKWKVEREEGTNWSTPFIWENKLRTEIVTSGSDKVRSYDLDGNLLYEFSGLSTITIATPYAADGLLYISSGFVADPNRPVYAIRPGAKGDITLAEGEVSNEYIAWAEPTGAPYNPSTLVYQGQLYVLFDRGMIAAYDAQTGEDIYAKERISGGRSFTASPWAYGGNIYCLNEFGETFVIKAGPFYELLHVNKLEVDQLSLSTPAIAGEYLILRTGEAVLCIGKAAP